MYELDDAKDHLENLTDQMAANGTIDDEDFRIQLSHIYSHLNCAWNGRHHGDGETQKLRDTAFPRDLEPL